MQYTLATLPKSKMNLTNTWRRARIIYHFDKQNLALEEYSSATLTPIAQPAVPKDQYDILKAFLGILPHANIIKLKHHNCQTSSTYPRQHYCSPVTG